MSGKMLIAAAMLAMSPQIVWAHAHPASSVPSRDEVVKVAPAHVTMTMTEGLEAAFSSMTLFDANGRQVSTGASTLVSGDDKTMMLPIATRLSAGVYTVKWHVLSKDGHKTQGSWSFTVQE